MFSQLPSPESDPPTCASFCLTILHNLDSETFHSRYPLSAEVERRLLRICSYPKRRNGKRRVPTVLKVRSSGASWIVWIHLLKRNVVVKSRPVLPLNTMPPNLKCHIAALSRGWSKLKIRGLILLSYADTCSAAIRLPSAVAAANSPCARINPIHATSNRTAIHFE